MPLLFQWRIQSCIPLLNQCGRIKSCLSTVMPLPTVSITCELASTSMEKSKSHIIDREYSEGSTQVLADISVVSNSKVSNSNSHDVAVFHTVESYVRYTAKQRQQWFEVKMLCLCNYQIQTLTLLKQL